MDALRISLIIIGAFLIGGIYFWGRYGQSIKSNFDKKIITKSASTVDNAIAAKSAKNIKQPKHSSTLDKTKAAAPSSKQIPEMIIIINLLAPGGQRFYGVDIFAASYEAGLVFGEKNIFHYPHPEDKEQAPIFDIANIVNPGLFYPEELKTITTPGLSMFMQLPGSIQSMAGFDIMLKVAHVFRERLGGDLCDQSLSALTPQTIGHIKEKILQYEFNKQMLEKAHK